MLSKPMVYCKLGKETLNKGNNLAVNPISRALRGANRFCTKAIQRGASVLKSTVFEYKAVPSLTATIIKVTKKKTNATIVIAGPLSYGVIVSKGGKSSDDDDNDGML